MNKASLTLHDIDPGNRVEDVTSEVLEIASMFAGDFDKVFFTEAMDDLGRLFRGEYPGFLAGSTAYHNLEHSLAVVLAMGRLLHGVHLSGSPVTNRNLQVGLLAAIFHDTGLIQSVEESEGSGARFTIGHEERSVQMATRYLADKGWGDAEIEDCGQIIRATILGLPFKDIPFSSDSVKTLGKALAAADLLAQMADRIYLEKLPLLYREFSEAGVAGFESELDILLKTESFCDMVAQPRLRNELDSIDQVMRLHFKARLQIDRDLYAEAISKNIKYLRALHSRCGEAYECYLANLRRNGTVEKKIEGGRKEK